MNKLVETSTEFVEKKKCKKGPQGYCQETIGLWTPFFRSDWAKRKWRFTVSYFGSLGPVAAHKYLVYSFVMLWLILTTSVCRLWENGFLTTWKSFRRFIILFCRQNSTFTAGCWPKLCVRTSCVRLSNFDIPIALTGSDGIGQVIFYNACLSDILEFSL